MKNYTVEHAEMTIYLSKKFNDALCSFDEDAKQEFNQLREFFPDYTVKVREIKRNANKRIANKNLTYPNMVRYMVSQPNGLKKLVEFAKVRNLSGQKGNGYTAVKEWFLKNYPAFLIYSVSEQEMENIQRFISLDKARELLRDFSNCETVEEIRDVVSTYFGETSEKVVSMEKVS